MLIQKYQESWAMDFVKIKEVLVDNLPGNAIKIEHIGSTSIKNLAAKPIIDIDIAYNKSQSFREIKMGLEKIGYFHNGNQGIKGREVFKRGKQKEHHLILDSIKHHLYVCPIDSEEFQRHLIFRDYLRGNEKDRQEYENLKYQIAKKTDHDRKEYARLKEVMARDFVESILKKAKKD